jgi:hypothetical protein
VGKKQVHCNPPNPADDHKGDYWNQIAYDPEHRLVLAVIPGAEPGERVFGTQSQAQAALAASQSINNSFVQQHHGTDRGRNAWKTRRTYRFSKEWRVHEAMTYFTMYSDNFYWPVRTLRVQDESGRWRQRTPAVTAGLTDHVWSLREWLTLPAVQHRWETAFGGHAVDLGFSRILAREIGLG